MFEVPNHYYQQIVNFAKSRGLRIRWVPAPSPKAFITGSERGIALIDAFICGMQTATQEIRKQQGN